MITIQQIAREAGVSTATVSRVFGNHPNVKADIRNRVFEVARSHGYFPRVSTRRRNVILITPSWAEYPVQNYVEMVVSNLARELSKRGYRIEILPDDSLDRLDSIQFCGAIRIGSGESPKPNWGVQFDAPLIVIDRELANAQANIFSVRSNEAQGMELAIDYLLKRGHRRIGSLVTLTKAGNPHPRAHYLEKALAARGLSPEAAPVRLVTEENFVEEVGKLLRAKPDAIFSPGGSGGILTAYALSLYSRRIPEDISLVASERSMISRYCVPPQTAITQDYGALASVAVDIIDARLRKQLFAQETVLNYQLIERDSVATRSAGSPDPDVATARESPR